MEQSKALHKLAEASDLILLLEDMISTEHSDRIAPSSWAGIRILMKSVRESIQQSRSVLAQDLITRSKEVTADLSSRAGLAAKVETFVTPNTQVHSPIQQTASSDVMMQRKDLKSSLERFIEAQ